MSRIRFSVCGMVLLSLAVLVFAACGKRGGPKPPESLAPAEVLFLTAQGASDGIVIRWTAPESNASGDELLDLQSFLVKRSDFVKDELPEYEEIANIAVARDANGVIVKREFEFRDTSVKPGVRYLYVVVGENDSGVEGKQTQTIRVTFTGISSQIQVQ